jgi:hypothetical protein
VLRFCVIAIAWFLLGVSPLPPNPNLTLTNTAISVIDSSGHIISTATLCPGYEFAQLGAAGPKFSPDQHWVLVDVLGPFEPGNVQRNHAIVDVHSGRFVVSPDFPKYLGVPGTLLPLAWASGLRATLRYQDGKTANVHDPPLQAFPQSPCPAPAALR